jgi:cellobiose epimerase
MSFPIRLLCNTSSFLRIIPAFILTVFLIACSDKNTTSESSSSETKGDSTREQIAKQIQFSLVNETLRVWYPQCVDSMYGGYLSSFTYDMKPTEQQQKMIVSQSRHLWVNSKSVLLYPGNAHFKVNAVHGFKFLRDVMWDKRFGGFYTLVSREGKVLDENKNAYGNAFGIYALSAYYAATKDTAGLNLAKRAFLWLEKNSHDAKHKGYFQHMRRDGSVIERTKDIDPKAETGYKDQNSSIHLLEAFTELYRVWPDALVRDRLQEMLLLVRDKLTTPKGHLVLFFTPDWKPVTFQDSSRETIAKFHSLDHVSFGHDIETAYLMLEASHVLGIHNDTTTLRKAKRMVDHTLANGWDESVGGFYDEGYYFKGEDTLTITLDTKNWWAQAEGMNSLLIMADLFPDDSARYYDKFVKQWNYINKYIIDHEHGDWYAGGIDKEPHQRTALKGHIWKSTYHHFRAMANCVKLLRGENELGRREF